MPPSEREQDFERSRRRIANIDPTDEDACFALPHIGDVEILGSLHENLIVPFGRSGNRDFPTVAWSLRTVQYSAVVADSAGRAGNGQSDFQCSARRSGLSIDLDDARHVHARVDSHANAVDILIANLDGRASPRLYSACWAGGSGFVTHADKEVVLAGLNVRDLKSTGCCTDDDVPDLARWRRFRFRAQHQ